MGKVFNELNDRIDTVEKRIILSEEKCQSHGYSKPETRKPSDLRKRKLSYFGTPFDLRTKSDFRSFFRIEQSPTARRNVFETTRPESDAKFFHTSKSGRQETHCSFGEIRRRFGGVHQSELARAQFKSRMKRKDESLPELASDLQRLFRLAYVTAEQDVQDVLARNQFIDALTDEETKLRVRQGRPRTIQHALEIALELESYALASKWG
ncbi:predicted protein [Nematostella vectensis]|uniref:Uncharacterized protein n=1 Tax=Nematostella vectensis TaxID=45351 RepID=A7SMI9_NEMVE|nr:predicted protein [Nematostella vectensis]|eukprot:XP_001627182.1 predicted protein [Nematostella vectensis]